MKKIFNGKVTVKNFIVAMLSALIIFVSVGSMYQTAYANGKENSEQTAQQTETPVIILIAAFGVVCLAYIKKEA